MYKKIIRLFLIMIVINTAWVMGKEGSRSSGDERSIIDRAEITTCNCGMTHRLGVHVGRDGERTITDTISYYTDPSYVEDYSDFMSGYQSTGDDSVVTRIHLLTAGVINQFHVMTRNLNPDGVVVDDYAPVDTWVYGPAYQQDDEGLWHAQYPSMGNTYDGAMESSLQLLMPYTIPTVFSNSDPENHFNAQGEWDPWAATSGGWNVFDFPTWTLDGLGINVVSDSLGVPDEMLYVYVGYNMVSTDPSGSVVDNIATIWQDGTVDENDNWSCRSTLHGQGTTGAWYGIWNSVYPYHHLTQAVVQYEAVPPFVEQLPNFSDTWAEEKEIWADVVDLDGDAFSCTLNVTIAPESGNSYDQEIAMMQDLEVEGRYIANVTMTVGDTVNFYVRATDVTGRSSTSSWRSFIRVATPSNAQYVLVLEDGTIDTLGGTWGSLYTSGDGLNQVLQGSQKYYIWNVNDRGGVDYDVINHPNFDLIVKYGWGGGTMPSTGEDIYGFGDFLDGGGRLLYSDMDYFWKTDLAADGNFSEGDFAYDYLGLSPAYRTSSQPLADLSELRLLLGFSNEAFFSLKDHLAVLPDAYSDLNVNTCSGLVLQTLATGLSLEQADSILATRTTEGAFVSVEAFLQQPELAGLGVKQEGLSVQSRFFEVKVRARFEDQIAYLTSILHRDPVTGAIVVVGRNSGEKFIMGTGIRQPVENSDG